MKSLLIEPLEARIAPATLTIAPASILEGDSGTKTLNFTVTLEGASAGEPVTVDFQTLSGTALEGSDYQAKSGTLTFAVGETSKVIAVEIIGDLEAEADETFTVGLSNPANASLATAAATGTILNDAKLSISDEQIVEGNEGEKTMLFTVTLTEGFDKPVTVEYQTLSGAGSGTATGETDYLATSGTLTFEPGQTSKTIGVQILGDVTGEEDETFTVQLSNPVNASLVEANGTGTILSDDAKLAITNQTKVEGDAGETMMSFTVTLSEGLSREVTVKYRTVDGTATAGSDYTEATGTVTFAPGETSKTIQVPIIGDLEGEEDELFTVELFDSEIATIATGTATGTILNDPKLSISAPQPVQEGNSGETQMVFTVTLTEGSSETVKVTYDVLDGLAPNGAVRGGSEADYSIASPTGELVFEPGETSKTITVTVLGDTRREVNETVRVVLRGEENATITQANAVGTILDDEPYEMGTITVNDVVITEGDSGSSTVIFTITLGTPVPSGQQLVVNYKTVDGTAVSTGALKDFDEKIGTLTFGPGETVKTVSVTVWGDRAYEGTLFGPADAQYRAEQFTLELDPQAKLQQSGTNNDLRTTTFTASGSKTVGVVTLRDTDSFPTLSISDAVVLEGNGNGQNKAQFTITLSEPLGFDVRVSYSLENGTAIAGSDFNVPAELFATIGKDQRTAVIEIPIIGDTVPELSENFRVKLESAVVATGAATGQPIAITRSLATGTIVNDEVKVEIDESTPVTIVEGDSGTSQYIVKLKLTGTHTQPVTVYVSTQDGTAVSSGAFADFQSATLVPVVFQPGEVSKEVPITIYGDTQREGNETFKVVITASDVELGGASGRLEQTVTITQEADEPAPTVSLSYQAPSGGLIEGGKATLTVTLSAPSNVDIEVPYTLQDGTAKSGQTANNDYVKGSNLKVIIPAGQTSATFTVDTLDDALREGNVPETFTVKLTPPPTGDDSPPATYLTETGSDTVVVGITDNDGNTPLPTISVSDVSIVEGNLVLEDGVPVKKYAVFTIKLSAITGQDVTVTASTLEGLLGDGLAKAGEDYVANTATVTILAGQQSATFSVEITGDAAIEPDERFFVRLSAPSENATLAREQATGTIQNDDAQFQILFKDADGNYTLPMITVDEEGAANAQQEVSFIIKRLGDLTGVAEARYSTVDGVDYMDGTTKVRGAVGSGPRPDFTSITDTVSFAAGQELSAPITVKLTPDGTYEGLEEFRIQLEGVVGSSGAVRITDNEAKPTVTIEAASVLERDASSTTRQQSSLVFKVKLSHVDETGLSMVLNTQDDTSTGAVTATSAAAVSGAAAKADYVALANAQLVFTPGETEKDIAVTVLGDNRDEHDETFKLVLSGLQGGTFGEDDEGVERTTLSVVGTILDNDAAPVVSITDLVTPSGTANEYNFTTYSETDTTTTSSVNKFFLVTLSGETEKIITVKYNTRSSADASPDENVYAIAGEDFVGVTDGVVTFDPNAADEDDRTVQQIKIAILNDTIVEGDQSFEVLLTESADATLGDKRGVAVIVEDTNDDPLLAINDIRLTEGDDLFTPQNAKFTVTLASKAQRAVTINYATADGTGKSSGLFADYIATSGQITFAPGETSQEIGVQILNDTYKEAAETFKVQLSGLQASNADVKFLGAGGGTGGTGAGTATIENGSDTLIGVGIKDSKVVEGAGVKLEVETSIAPEMNTQFNVAVRSGTASIDSDFRASVQNPTGKVTIAAGQTTALYQEYSTISDSDFEASEHFFADLSGGPAGTEVVKGTARVEIYNDDVRQVDDRTVQWIDLDGDLVTLKVSKGSLDGSNINWVLDNGSVKTSAVGGRALLSLSLLNTEFQGANITITSERQSGFTGDMNGLLGDERVNVGIIQAGSFVVQGLIFAGIDLGKVKVDGDLGGIYVGDRFLDRVSLKKLDVYSLGANPESTGLASRDTPTGPITGVNTASFIQGTVGAIKVRTDFAGSMEVRGGEYGDIRSLNIGGSLRGLDNFNQTGSITFTGTLNKATIGQILGGVGDLSGRIVGDALYDGNIGSIKVKGDISGNSGTGSAVIAVSSIGKAKVGRVLGGGGDDSGQIRAGLLKNVIVQEDVIGFVGKRSGAILTDKALGSQTGVGAGVVKIGGRLIGGAGELSGIVSSLGGFNGVTVSGKIVAGDDLLFSDITATVSGGEGLNSGRIESAGLIGKLQLGQKGEVAAERISLEGGVGTGSGTIDARGGIARTNLYGSIQGGDSADSGVVKAAFLGNARIFGDLRGGDASGSGVVAVDGAIRSLVVDGSIKGGSSRAATEDSAGTVVNTTGAVLAGRIDSMTVTGDVVAGRNLGAGLSGSASIAVNGTVGQLTIKGSLLGHDNSMGAGNSVIEEENVYAKILVFGDEKKAAIGKLKIGGDVALAEISAGVSIRSEPEGFPVNADAWIKSVAIGGDVRGMSITAGANKGPDGIFGTSDDAVLSGAPKIQINDAKRFSSIASVIIKGSVSAETEAGSVTPLPFGLVAQLIGSVKVGSQSVSLQPGAGNDIAPGKAVGSVDSFRVIELPIA